MQIPRHWRLNSQRYALQGVTCSHCSANIFPPRQICPYCESQVEAPYALETRTASPRVSMSAALDRAAR